MKQLTIFDKATNLIAAALMLFFSMTKLIGGKEVIEGFKQFESFVPIDINILRIFTGIVELSIGVLLILYTFKNKSNIGKLAYFILLSTMAGALLMEFFARPEPMMMMVIIAMILLILSIYKLKVLFIK